MNTYKKQTKGRTMTTQEYSRCVMENKRNGYDHKYFRAWYLSKFHPKYLVEEKIFNYHDMFYISKINKGMYEIK